jgi:hypothetical protein
MRHIAEVTSAIAFRYPFPIGGDRILLAATGTVISSGWSNARLTPRFYIRPPADGIWDFDFMAEEPSGIVLPVTLPVAAYTEFGAPDWLKGLRIHAEKGAFDVKTIGSAKHAKSAVGGSSRLRTGHVIVKQVIASYDDSFNIIGSCGGFSLKMKKLHHELTLTVEGPDEGSIRSCIERAAGAGLIAAIIAAFATGGGALGAAIAAFIAELENCLGNQYQARIDDTSHWVEWCT